MLVSHQQACEPIASSSATFCSNRRVLCSPQTLWSAVDHINLFQLGAKLNEELKVVFCRPGIAYVGRV
jgi:hypothetical protein